MCTKLGRCSSELKCPQFISVELLGVMPKILRYSLKINFRFEPIRGWSFRSFASLEDKFVFFAFPLYASRTAQYEI